jgi:hypothetical protein
MESRQCKFGILMDVFIAMQQLPNIKLQLPDTNSNCNYNNMHVLMRHPDDALKRIKMTA